jgi:hypothetical protein
MSDVGCWMFSAICHLPFVISNGGHGEGEQNAARRGYPWLLSRLVSLPSLVVVFALSAQAANWVPATGNLANMASECGNLCRIFLLPNSGRVIAGVAGAGLWVTTNGGALWAKLGGADSKIKNRPQQILFDPANADVFWEVGIYTAPRVFKTTNGGVTFTPMGGISHNDGLAIDFTDPRRLNLIATGHETNRKIYKSSDGGASFIDIGTNFPNGAKFTSGCFSIDDKTYVVACTGWGPGQGGIWRTTDGGTNWTQVCTNMPNFGGPVLRTTKGFFYWGCSQGGRLLKGTSDGAAWNPIPAPGARPVSPVELPGGVIATLGKDAILISIDDGATWRTVAPGLPIPTGDHTIGGLAYNAVAGAAYVWFWDCHNVVRPDAIWRYDLALPPNPPN